MHRIWVRLLLFAGLALLLPTFMFMLTMPTEAAVLNLYVQQAGGNDANLCNSPSVPCATIGGAVVKVPIGTVATTINVFAGTYPAFSIPITGHVAISGTSLSSVIIDGGGATAITIDGIGPDVTSVTIDAVTIRNGGTLGTTNGGGVVITGTVAPQVTIKNSMLQNNKGALGGAVYNQSGTLTITRSSIQTSQATTGGGIYTGSGATTLVTQTAVITNTATAGRGAYNAGTLIVVNSTVSDNPGGGIVSAGTTGLYNVTVSGNTATSGGGGVATTGGTTTLANTIVGGNTGSDCSGGLTSAGYNIIGNTTGCSFTASTGDQVNVNPLLAPLAMNGGFSLTQSFSAISPALNAGDPGGCKDQFGNVLTVDQRNEVRPRGPRCDVGALELKPALYLPMIMR